MSNQKSNKKRHESTSSTNAQSAAKKLGEESLQCLARIGGECIKNEQTLRTVFPMIYEVVKSYSKETATETPTDETPTDETPAEKALDLLVEKIEENLMKSSSTMSMGEVYYRIGYNPRKDPGILQFRPSDTPPSVYSTLFEDISLNDKILHLPTTSHSAVTGSDFAVIDEMELMSSVEKSTAPETILEYPVLASETILEYPVLASVDTEERFRVFYELHCENIEGTWTYSII